MKKLLSLTIALAMLLSISAVALAADPVTLVYSEVNPETSFVGTLGAAFKAKVEELSGGQIIIDAHYSGTLGTEAQILDDLLGGGTSVDILRVSAFALTSYGCTKSTLLSIPYTFVNREHFWNFANSALAKEFLNQPQELGIPLRGLFYGEEGFRHFFFATGIEANGIEDLAGLKIRVSDDPVMTGMVKNLGANPTVYTYTELYSGLEKGDVDAAEQPIANYYAMMFQEVAPTLILDGHTLGAISAVITDTAWAKLNEEQQGWIMEAAAYVQQYNQAQIQAAEDAVLAKLIDEGYKVVEVPDKSAWVAACQPTIEKYTSDQAELYQQSLDMQ
jgi:TRAP-type C4-dicarboxylate transport system substrate-binding protein